jgi:hypothetical protein
MILNELKQQRLILESIVSSVHVKDRPKVKEEGEAIHDSHSVTTTEDGILGRL